jgi:integrase
MSFVYKRKDSSFYWYGYYDKETGKPGKPFSLKTPNKNTARIRQKEWDEKLEQRTKEKAALQDPELNIIQAFQLYKQFKENTGNKLSPLTVNSYNDAIKIHFIPSAGNKPVFQYTKSDYHKFINSMSGNSQNTRSVYSKRIYALFQWLLKEEYIKKNPMERVAEEKKPIKILTPDQLNKFFEYAETTKFKYVAKFQRLSAFRIHEVLKIRPVDIKEKEIEIMGKGKKLSSIPITNKMRALLKELPMPENKEDRVFPFSKHAMYRFFTRASQATGIKFKTHDLRKYRLSEIVNSGIPINFAARYGRITIAIAMKYYIDQDVNKIGEMIDERVDK